MNALCKVCLLAPCFLVAADKLGVHADLDMKGTYFPDVVKVFQNFVDVAAIFDSNDDAILECLVGTRTAFDPDARTATYTWTIHSPDGMPREQPYFSGQATYEPGYFTYFTNDDPTPNEGFYLYSDYETCVIMIMDYFGTRCLLGVQPDLKDSVPQHCIDSFVTNCGAVVPVYSQDLCFDGEGDY